MDPIILKKTTKSRWDSVQFAWENCTARAVSKLFLVMQSWLNSVIWPGWSRNVNGLRNVYIIWAEPCHPPTSWNLQVFGCYGSINFSHSKMFTELEWVVYFEWFSQNLNILLHSSLKYWLWFCFEWRMWISMNKLYIYAVINNNSNMYCCKHINKIS